MPLFTSSLVEKTRAGRIQAFTINITSAANAGAVTFATATIKAMKIKAVSVRANAAITSTLTSITITCGASAVVTIFDTTEGARANIAAADQQISKKVDITLPKAATMVITLAGTDATAVNFQIDVEAYAIADGGYLA